MKKMIRSVIAVAVMLTSCINEDGIPQGEDPNAPNTGSLVVPTITISEEVEEVATDTRAADPAVSDFVVVIRDKADGSIDLDTTVGAMRAQATGGGLELPVGRYSIEVASSRQPKVAAWEEPYYLVSKDFEIQKGKSTELGNLACKLSNIKVSVVFTPDFLAQLNQGDGKVEVSLGAEKLAFVQTETRAGYFKATAPDGLALETLLWELSGTVEGKPLERSGSVRSVKAGQHHILTFDRYEAPITSVINTPARADVWATQATLTAQVANPTTTTIAEFAYRANSTGSWTKVTAEIGQNGACSTKLTSLTAGTTYQATLFVDGAQIDQSVEFTTEAAAVLENGNFEGWQKPARPWLVYAEGAEQYWDTGNHGSTTLSANGSITTPNDDVRPGSAGVKSANLQSTFVGLFGIGKFAAGNLFYGVYAGTEGMNGKVDFGQPFASRPTALHGWYKVHLGNVTHADSSAPVAKGAPDEAQILVCLTDWEGRHQVNTGDSTTFLNYETNTGVIAYGDIVRKADDGGKTDEWVEFMIPLTYRSTERVPTYLVVSASSSRYGDYFTGSTDSWIRVDDFELVYDDNIVTKND